MEETYDDSSYRKPVNCRLITAMQAGHQDFHFHEYYEIYLLMEGEISYYVEQSCCHMKAGDLILFTNQEIHKAVNLRDTPFTRMVLHIDPMYVWQFCTAQTNLMRCFHQHRPGINNMISLTPEQFTRFEEYVDRIEVSCARAEYGDDLSGVTALIELLLMINESFLFLPNQEPDAYVHRLQPAMNYIDKHLAEAITLDSVAQACSLDKFYLSHLFKKETETTIFQYILIKRVVMAKELLSLGTSVADAARQSGFNDYANFIRTFKKVTGYSPGYFKRMNRDAL